MTVFFIQANIHITALNQSLPATITTALRFSFDVSENTVRVTRNRHLLLIHGAGISRDSAGLFVLVSAEAGRGRQRQLRRRRNHRTAAYLH